MCKLITSKCKKWTGQKSPTTALTHLMRHLIIINRSLSVTLLFLWVSAKLFYFVLSEALMRDQDLIGADLPPPSLARYVLDDLDAASSSLEWAICRPVEQGNDLETCPPRPMAKQLQESGPHSIW